MTVTVLRIARVVGRAQTEPHQRQRVGADQRVGRHRPLARLVVADLHLAVQVRAQVSGDSGAMRM